MYGGRGGGSGLGGSILIPAAPTVAGIAVLPNTGGNRWLLLAALLSTIIGGVVLLTTILRQLAKRYYKA